MTEFRNLQIIEDEKIGIQLYEDWGGSPTQNLYPQSLESFHGFLPEESNSFVYKFGNDYLGVVFWDEDDSDGGFWFITNPSLDSYPVGKKIVSSFLDSGIALSMGIMIQRDDHIRRKIVTDLGMITNEDQETDGIKDYKLYFNDDFLDSEEE